MWASTCSVPALLPRVQIETMYDATCQKIRETAETYKLAVPESLRPTTLPGPKNMYHINLSGALPPCIGVGTLGPRCLLVW